MIELSFRVVLIISRNYIEQIIQGIQWDSDPMIQRFQILQISGGNSEVNNIATQWTLPLQSITTLNCALLPKWPKHTTETDFRALELTWLCDNLLVDHVYPAVAMQRQSCSDPIVLPPPGGARGATLDGHSIEERT